MTEFPERFITLWRAEGREVIVWQDDDRRTFVRTGAGGGERAGFRVRHGLMSDH